MDLDHIANQIADAIASDDIVDVAPDTVSDVDEDVRSGGVYFTMRDDVGEITVLVCRAGR